MTSMTRKGAHPRATDVRSAANRLRWEVDLALGVWPNYTPKPHEPREVVEALYEIAETVAILHRVLMTISERTPENLRTGVLDGRTIEQRFAGLLEHHSRMHETPR